MPGKGTRVNIEHLVEFAELARQLNFTAAARTLHMTQPALSNHIRALEKEAGAILVERAGVEKTRLTPEGQCFLDMCLRILAVYDEMMPRIREMHNAIEGKIAIRSPRSEYSYPLMDYIFEFRKEHPRIDVAMLPWVNTDGVFDVLSGAVDCAYIGHVDPNTAVHYETGDVAFAPYTKSEVFLWVDAGHELSSRHGSLSPRDLDGRHILIPANEKRESWALGIENICRDAHISCPIDEKYCDSFEDLLLNKAVADDLLLCDTNTLKFSTFRLRDDRVTMRFNPSLMAPVSLGYVENNDNVALHLFVEFLRSKYEAL